MSFAGERSRPNPKDLLFLDPFAETGRDFVEVLDHREEGKQQDPRKMSQF